MTDCMVKGCSASSGSSLHYLPKDPELRQKWMDFIYKNRVAPDCVDRIRICSIHFTEECFTNYRQKLMGFSKRLILRPTAVPTIDLQSDNWAALSQQEETGGKESDAMTVWFCPLCQQGKRNRHTLALHLTKKHSVLPACLEKLLDSAAPVSPSTHEDGESSAQITNETSKEVFLENSKSSLLVFKKDLLSGPACVPEVGAKDETGALIYKEDNMTGVVPTNNAHFCERSDAEGDGNPPFRCDACLEPFPTKTTLSDQASSALHGQKSRTKAGNEDSMRALLRRYVSYKPYQCDVCNVAYNHAITLESHLKSVLHQTRARSAAKAAKAKSNSGSRKVTTKFLPPVASGAQLPSPLTPAQALSAYLPVLTFTPSSIVPSVFTTPNSTTPQMLLVNGLQTNGPASKSLRHAWQRTLHLPQQALSVRVPNLTPSSTDESDTFVEGVAVKVEVEIKEEQCEQEVSQIPQNASPTPLDLKREPNGVKFEEEAPEEATSRNLEENESSKDATKAVTDIQRGRQSSKIKDFPKSNPSKMTTRVHPNSNFGSPVLNEFQSQVLLAFLESRTETGSCSPSRDDCETLGREVGLTQEEVKRWLVDVRLSRRVVGGVAERRPILRSSTVFLSEEEDGDEDQTAKGRKRTKFIRRARRKMGSATCNDIQNPSRSAN